MQILVADDHKLVRDGLRPFLHELDPAVEVLDAATLGEALLMVDSTPGLGLVLLDLMMPGMDGLSGLLPFLYESTGVETFFRDERDPSPR